MQSNLEQEHEAELARWQAALAALLQAGAALVNQAGPSSLPAGAYRLPSGGITCIQEGVTTNVSELCVAAPALNRDGGRGASPVPLIHLDGRRTLPWEALPGEMIGAAFVLSGEAQQLALWIG